MDNDTPEGVGTPTEQKRVHTEYGEITLEVVECDSCNQFVAVESAEEYEIGDDGGFICRFCAGDASSLANRQPRESSEDGGEEKPFTLQMLASLAAFSLSVPILLLLAYPFGIRILSFWQGFSIWLFGVFVFIILYSLALEGGYIETEF